MYVSEPANLHIFYVEICRCDQRLFVYWLKKRTMVQNWKVGIWVRIFKGVHKGKSRTIYPIAAFFVYVKSDLGSDERFFCQNLSHEMDEFLKVTPLVEMWNNLTIDNRIGIPNYSCYEFSIRRDFQRINSSAHWIKLAIATMMDLLALTMITPQVEKDQVLRKQWFLEGIEVISEKRKFKWQMDWWRKGSNKESSF
jgi:hypothetical protein